MEAGVLVEVEQDEMGFCEKVQDPASKLMYSPETEDIHGRPTNVNLSYLP